METLSVALGDRSYPILIGTKLLYQSHLYISHIHGAQVFIVTNETIAPLYLNNLKNSLDAIRPGRGIFLQVISISHRERSSLIA